MIIAVAKGDVLAAAVVHFDLEPVADIAGVIYGIEVVDRAIGDTGLQVLSSQREQRTEAPGLQTGRNRRFWKVGSNFHFDQVVLGLEFHSAAIAPRTGSAMAQQP